MTVRRVLFASYHSHHDPTSGAAVCTRDLFAQLVRQGWECGVFTGPNLDDPHASPVAEVLRSEPDITVVPGSGFRLFNGRGSGYTFGAFCPDPPAANRPPSNGETAAFLGLVEKVIAKFRPQVVLTYGGDPASQGVIPLARQAGAKVVFWLHNFAYTTAAAFRGCDAVVVPSTCSRDHYRAALGINCVVLPPVLDPSLIVAEQNEGPKFVTFVNPEPVKGVFWFARLAEVLGTTRPDIGMLVVEGRGRVDWLGQCRVDLTPVMSLRRMKNTTDPRKFYRLAKFLLVPSVWRESFGRVAAESLLNRLPVIASDRGALPEVVGRGGVCLQLPAWLTPETRIAPTTAEVRPWVDAIIRWWDDETAYEAARAAARLASERWHPDSVVRLWEEFLTTVAG